MTQSDTEEIPLLDRAPSHGSSTNGGNDTSVQSDTASTDNTANTVNAASTAGTVNAAGTAGTTQPGSTVTIQYSIPDRSTREQLSDALEQPGVSGCMCLCLTGVICAATEYALCTCGHGG